jgi:hypothetical protein
MLRPEIIFPNFFHPDEGFRYCREHGPFISSPEELLDVSQAEVFTSHDSMKSKKVGGNCQLFAHILLEELGRPLPKHLRSKELYHNRRYLYTVDDWNDQRQGDIYFFGKEYLRDMRYLHLAILLYPDQKKTIQNSLT